MTDNKELTELIARLKRNGVSVFITYDKRAQAEGREIIDTVQVAGVFGIGPFPMSAIGAAEAMRRVLADPKNKFSR